MYSKRVELYKRIEGITESKVLAYVTGERQGLETRIHSEVLDFFADHLDSFDYPKRVCLIIHSRGGETLAGWSIANMIRSFADEFVALVPAKALSAATLIVLGADKIYMTKQATLGPIDPSVNSPLNPAVPGAPPNSRIGISVEDVAGYFDLAKEELGIKNKQQLTEIFEKLSDQVHPVALGTVYRSRKQIQMLARRLLHYHMKDEKAINKIVATLCSESGSHDYTINRREARNELSMPIEKPDEDFYKVIKEVYNDIRGELEFRNPYNPNVYLAGKPSAQYSFTRALIESVTGGSHKFISEGAFHIQPNGQLTDARRFEGWRHEA